MAGVPPCARTMPAARDEAPIPASPRSRTTTRPAPSPAAKTDAQPPTVPAPTTTRSARSVTRRSSARPRSAVERGRLDARRDDAETLEPTERGPASDRPGDDLESRPAGRATDPGSIACQSTETARHSSSAARLMVAADRSCAFSQRGQAGARPATRSSVAGSNDETTALTRSWTPPGGQDLDDRPVVEALELDIEDRPMRDGVEDVGEGRDPEVLEVAGADLRRRVRAGPGRAPASRRGAAPGRRRTTGGRRTRRRRRPAPPARPGARRACSPGRAASRRGGPGGARLGTISTSSGDARGGRSGRASDPPGRAGRTRAVRRRPGLRRGARCSRGSSARRRCPWPAPAARTARSRRLRAVRLGIGGPEASGDHPRVRRLVRLGVEVADRRSWRRSRARRRARRAAAASARRAPPPPDDVVEVGHDDEDLSPAGQVDDRAMRRPLQAQVEPLDVAPAQRLADEQAVAVLGPTGPARCAA